jgi:hypothetical protein
VVLTGSTCGELIAGRGSRALEVTAGRPELVIQDAFATERPLAQIRSLNGKYDLLQFEERYEVHDVATGAKLIEHAGVDATFSPTSRLLVGRNGTDRSLEIIDYVATIRGQRPLLRSGVAAERQLRHLRVETMGSCYRPESRLSMARNFFGLVQAVTPVRRGITPRSCSIWTRSM